MDATKKAQKSLKKESRRCLQRQRTRRCWQVLTYLALGLFFVFFLGPIVWIFLSSFKKPVDVRAIPPVWVFKPVLDQYVAIFWRKPIWAMLLNSLLATGGSVLIAAPLGSAAAYGISRMGRKARNLTSFFFLSYRVIPLAVLVVPLYEIFKSLRLYDTHFGLILAYTNITLPIIVWMMTNYFNGIPVELEEAAMLDGCSRLRCFLHVALPLVVPGLIATCALCMALVWSDFLLAVVLTGPNTKTIAVEIRGAGGGRQGAISVVTALPILALGLFLQRRLVQGLTMGAVKG